MESNRYAIVADTARQNSMSIAPGSTWGASAQIHYILMARGRLRLAEVGRVARLGWSRLAEAVQLGAQRKVTLSRGNMQDHALVSMVLCSHAGTSLH
jgi:hypothetical protein